MAYIKFNDNSLYRDTYLLGGYAGFDFNEYIGLRGFYFQTTQNEELSTKFDEMAMYGMEFRARLNDGNGVTPYLMLGGGYLNAYANYMGKGNVTVESSEFATGGLGLNIPLGKRLLISGGARAMITSGADIEDVNATDDLQTHLMYTAGLKLSLGKKSTAPQEVYDENLSKELALQQAENNSKISQLKASYQDEINALENDLQKAYDENNVEKAVAILEDKKKVEESLEQVDKIDEVNKSSKIKAVAPSKIEEVVTSVEKQTEVVPNEMMQMTPAEFEVLIERILNKIDHEADAIKTNSIDSENKDIQIKALQDRIDRLEKLLLDTKSNTGSIDASNLQQAQVAYQNEKIEELSHQILDKINTLSGEIEENSNKINDINQQSKIGIINPEVNVVQLDSITNTDNVENLSEETNIKDILNEEGPESFAYLNTSAFVGVNLGGATTGNLGLRLHYAITNSSLIFMPEAFLGFGEATTFGGSGNLIYPIKMKSEKVEPYVGAGIGVGKIADKGQGFYNVILGANLPFLNENLYVDYMMRNTFSYNQIAIGYKFNF